MILNVIRSHVKSKTNEINLISLMYSVLKKRFNLLIDNVCTFCVTFVTSDTTRCFTCLLSWSRKNETFANLYESVNIYSKQMACCFDQKW